MYIIDRLEHGNGGCYGQTILDKLPLGEALKKTPMDYGIYTKEFGFWPVICRGKDMNKPDYYWSDYEEKWMKCVHSPATVIYKADGFYRKDNQK